ncbi:hypothetical protein K469DRAFT_105182 [Zopfia rhizophila CBS 207.26]|uniref:Uncharacterized protein n=1 Tax=Zopfia rhizophila CBS 207.26 TaxID=1314779 RepID=A0A6A6EAB4_9PEZI|nr:hypothetical protein K469DRAFT_105182 [Zopfia rhizophila CBS 207.26]
MPCINYSVDGYCVHSSCQTVGYRSQLSAECLLNHPPRRIKSHRLIFLAKSITSHHQQIHRQPSPRCSTGRQPGTWQLKDHLGANNDGFAIAGSSCGCVVRPDDVKVTAYGAEKVGNWALLEIGHCWKLKLSRVLEERRRIPYSRMCVPICVIRFFWAGGGHE